LEKLESLSERLAIGRLDGTVLLSAGLVTFLTTALATWLPRLIESVTGFPSTMTSAFGFSVVFAFALGMVWYTYAYLQDHLSDRRIGIQWFAIGSWLFFIDVYTPAIAYLGELGKKCPLNVKEVIQGMIFLASVPVSLVVAILILGFFNSSLTNWMQKNIPGRWRTEGKSVFGWENYLGAHSGYVWAAGFGLIAQTGIVTFTLVCGVLSGGLDSRELTVLIWYLITASLFGLYSLGKAGT
jgi:hypothetical protein